jgi:hypothetical protein
MRYAAATLVCLAACGNTGAGIALTLDTTCSETPVTSVEIDIAAQPSGEMSTQMFDPTAVKRIVIVPPADAKSIDIGLKGFDAQEQQVATSSTQVTINHHGLYNVEMSLACSTACTIPCATDELCCGTACVVPDTDPFNCSGCDVRCSPNNIQSSCSAGKCTGTCDTGFADCNDDKLTDGCEADLMTDSKNCGACGQTCAGTCIAGACPRRVFVSSQLYSGNLGGVAGGDAKCQALADAANLGGTYLAWLSTTSAAAPSRFHGALNWAYVLPTGTIIANNLAELLASGPKKQIDITEKMTQGPAGTASFMCAVSATGIVVWTDTLDSGVIASGTQVGFDDCTGWTSEGADNTFVGDAGTTNAWSAQCQAHCSGMAALYCFEQ